MFNSYRTDVETALRGISQSKVNQAVSVLKRAKGTHSSVYILGNGGSAATAGHFANDLVKMCGIRAFSLPAMMPLVTACGNDDGWERMFLAPLGNFLIPTDVVIAVSCSGASPNVVDAMTVVSRGVAIHDVGTIGLTGDNLKSPLAKLDLDVLISVPFRDIRVQEDCHMVICHAIVGALRGGSDAK